MSFRDLLGKELLFFDGGMGTMLQAAGLAPGEIPEYWNMEHPEAVCDIHYQYYMAGANIVETNTFGANSVKMPQDKYTSHDVMIKAVGLAKEAAEKCKKETGRDKLFVAASMGPTGKLMQPMGDLTFDAAYEGFKELAIAAEEAGADLALIETMTDLYEIKAAILGVKENTNLPVVVSAMLDEGGKLLTGADIKALCATLEGLRVDAVGINCGFGPKQIARFIPEYLSLTSLPMMVNPNAGMPKTDDNGDSYYDMTPEDFAAALAPFAEKGVFMLGGCCGTNPNHIHALVQAAKDMTPPPVEKKHKTVVASYSHAVEIGRDFAIIGEKINPTGNKVFKEALLNNDMGAVVKLALDQQRAGAHIIDVNAGLPEIDEVSMLTQLMREIQAVVDSPLMLDTASPEAMEKAVRYYNGKPFINSVSGKQDSMDRMLPIAAKYGGVLIALTLDEKGIPKTPEERVAIALKIVEEAAKYGIEKHDIVVDPLTLTVSADKEAPMTTLETIWQLRQHGIKTSIGVSNVSFGLPGREKLTSTFLAMALSAGLRAAIMNPFSDEMMYVYHSYMALAGKDENCRKYIKVFEAHQQTGETAKKENKYSLKEAIINGLKKEAREASEALGKDNEPLAIINEHVIPALDVVGKRYEDGTIYLPQLLMSAEASQEAFAVVKGLIEKSGNAGNISKGKVVLATVKGDVHDIGKNIVRVLLENYGYDVIDLGKDVPAELIVETAKKEGARLVGLSALMTTTLPSMAETIRQLKDEKVDCKIAVGGAVLNETYADTIGADCYCKDAMATVKYAEQLFGH